AELVIVQDAYFPTETTRYAHIVLPAAVNFEQDGTFCNSERRVTLMQQVVQPPGDAMPDWWWVKQVAAAMAFTVGLKHETAAQIFDEFARTTGGRPNDQSALHHELLRVKGPQQWPYPAMGRSSSRRYDAGVFPTPSGKARFWARPYEADGDPESADFPLVLNTGRVLNQWHTRTKSGNVEQLNKLDPAPYIQMHPDDAAQSNVREGQRVRVCSSRGECVGVVRIEASAVRGSVFVPIHWNDLYAALASPNETTTPQADPISRQPALKFCRVRIESVRENVSFDPARLIGS
ncbi:MAG TPA: molybdopterin dinucleotide binding domain-containing protein, partial [Tepidisphaeraceae bacterium]|nr:molybdopterin dinucleotide binding domain-containing protein [Tepidisphaeraceae bacterium]